MPDPKVVITGGGAGVEGKIEFYNDDGTEIGSIEPQNTEGDSSTDKVKLDGMNIDGGTF